MNLTNASTAMTSSVAGEKVKCWKGFPDVILWKGMIPSFASTYFSGKGVLQFWEKSVIYMVTAVLSLNRLVPMLLSNP